MRDLTLGSLCSGYGGLDLAVESFFGAQTVWHAEYESAPSKVLATHWPRVPNLGDMTRVDWASVKPTRIICGGTSCQDLSGAGKRAGMREGTRSNIWVEMRECVAATRPDLVIWENVRGACSAYAASDVEHEPGLLGETYGPDRPALRALGRVLGDLSDLGYDTEWVGVRASDAGAPHARFRVFVLAYARCVNGELGRAPVHMVGAQGAGAGSIWGVERYAVEHRSPVDWGQYAPAIARWERELGRVAPAPTEPGAAKNGSRRLSARFEEWMMGLPDGWVTDPRIGLTWGEQVKALGNGVVPQQATLALSILWPRVADSLAVAA